MFTEGFNKLNKSNNTIKAYFIALPKPLLKLKAIYYNYYTIFTSNNKLY